METSQQLQNRLRDEAYARDHFLGGRVLDLSMHWILSHIDCFVRLSRANKSVENVRIYPYDLEQYSDEVLDRVGQAVGNLQALEELKISNHNSHNNHEESGFPIPDWERLPRILSHMRQNVKVTVYNGESDTDLWSVGEVHGIARAIRGHPTITSFVCEDTLPQEASDILYSALATLPALESIRISSPPEGETTLANRESLTDLLRAPSLRSVCFSEFYFTSALCQAAANALVEGTAITNLDFGEDFGECCSFPTRECAAVMANGLSRNTSVISVTVKSKVGGALFDVLTAALPLNSTLQELSFGLVRSGFGPGAQMVWSPIFLALGRNTGLKFLTVDNYYYGSMDESLCTAMQNGLGTNDTLERLEFKRARLCDDTTGMWCRAFCFLRINKALKSLVVQVRRDVTEVSLSAFRIGIVSMLEENASLESLSIRHDSSYAIGVEVYIELVTMLQHNTALKKLELSCDCDKILQLTSEEDKLIAKSLQKNYVLESLPNIINRPGDVRTILRLNAAGRRYLIENGSSVSKGVEVLSRVNNDINCVFLHLLENPRLCDRSAVEVASDSIEKIRGSVNPANHNGKREQGRALEDGKESRRRRT